MAKIRQQSFLVPSTGVGRVDYSQNIQQSVEPITRSWQLGYDEYRTANILAGDSYTEVIYPSAVDVYVVLPYDFYLSTYPAVDCALSVEFLSRRGNWIKMLHPTGNGFVEFRLAKGFPLSTWRFTAFNLDVGAADFFFSAHGITTSETDYFGGATSGSLHFP